MKKKYLLGALGIMTIGFAAVSTTLYINGTANIKKNDEDFKVYYSDAYVNGTQDKSVITADNKIVFNTTLDQIGKEYVLDYDVTNGSKNYDADLEMVCTSGNEYLSVINDFDDTEILEALDTRSGNLTLEMIKSNAGDDVNVTIECTIKATAVERDSLATETVDPVTFCNAKGYLYGMLNGATYYDGPILGAEEYYLCSDLDEFEEYHGYDEDGNLVTVNGIEPTEAETVCINEGYMYGIDFEEGYEGLYSYSDSAYICSNDDTDFVCYGEVYDINGNYLGPNDNCNH